MALMKFREQNHVLWRGSRPGHDGTQVQGEGYKAGTGNAVVYTVTAGLTLYLTYAFLSTRQSLVASGGAGLTIYTAVPAVWRDIFFHLYDLAGQKNSAQAFTFPLEIPADYTIRVTNDHLQIDAYGIIWGWEE